MGRLLLTVALHLQYEAEAVELCFSSPLLSQLYKVFVLYSLVIVVCLVMFDAIEAAKRGSELRRLRGRVHPEAFKAKEAHRAFHMRMNCKHQTVNCANDPTFVNF